MALLRGLYEQPSGHVSAEGVEALRALSGTLTTALDTLPDTREAERHDPGNAGLLDGQRLSRGFVHDLTSGYQPDPSATQRFGSPANEADLAALVGLSDPPTAVAVAIANSRMRRRLTMHYSNADTDALAPNAWGPNGGLISAYARMLNRNDDAAIQFLQGDGVLEGALRRHESYYLDGGAVVELVRTGWTDEDPSIRQPLMHRAITEVGGRDTVGPFPMVEVLTDGYGWNREYISRLESTTDYQNTANMLGELMKDPVAKDRIVRYTESFLENRAGTPSGPRNEQLIQLGRLHQLNVEGEINVLVDDLNDARDRAARMSKIVDFTIGNLPGGRTITDVSERLDLANEILGQVSGTSVGEMAADPSSHQFRHALGAVAADEDKTLARLGIRDRYGDDANAFKRGTDDVADRLRGWNLPED